MRVDYFTNLLKRSVVLLQLENYDLERYQHVFIKRFFEKTSPRQKIVWTPKLIAVVVFGSLLHLILVFIITSLFLFFVLLEMWQVFIVFLLFLIVTLPGIFVSLSGIVWLISPVDFFLKRKIVREAKEKIKTHKENLTVIAVAGSYGKTTTKEVVYTLLNKKYKVLESEGNKNTPLGISRLVLDSLTEETEILLLEMGAYKKGDIAELCDLVRPDIAILTGINESHLERFGSIENTIQAKFEVVSKAHPHGLVVLNADNAHVRENAKLYIHERIVQFYSSQNLKESEYAVKNKKFYQDGSGISFDLFYKQKRIGYFKLPFLADYAIGTLIAAVSVARALGMDAEEITSAASMIQPVAHRLCVKGSENDILVIDDSYNGNPDGVREAIEVMNKFKKRRKLYVTPGLVEMGHRKLEIHYEIGRRLAQSADKVFLVRNSVTGFIRQGLEDNGFLPKNIIESFSATELHKEVQKMTKPGDLILFQNDWPDNYL